MHKFYWLLGLSLFITMTVAAQSIALKGQIKNQKGEPVAYATITIKKTLQAVSADQNGNFTINITPGTVLLISAVGYKQQEITAGKNTVLNLVLVNESSLDEVVVTALGIRREEKSLGYSVAKVNPDVLVQKSEPDVLKGMQGKVAGVDIRSSQGTPGAATRIQIRGSNSFFGNSQPLIVVDGIPYSNEQVTTSSQTSGGSAYSSGIANLDPNDIASMNVLKGSSAAALYGSRASNGVLVITTKSGGAAKGRKGFEVTVKSSTSVEEIANLPVYQNKYGAGTNFVYGNSNGSWGPAFESRDSIPVWPSYRAAYPDMFPTDSVAYRPDPDNVAKIFRKGIVYENSVSFQGGDAKSSVAATLSKLDHTGYVHNSFYKRYNIGVGAQTTLLNGVTFRGNLSYARSNQQGGYFGENQVDGAASMFARALFLARNWDMSLPFETPLNNNVTWNGGGQFDHPLWSAKYNTANTAEERVIAGFHADYNFRNWLRLDYNLGSNVNTLGRREVTEISSRAAQGIGRLILDNYRNHEIESVFLVTATPKISRDFDFKGIVGHNYNQRTIENVVQEGNGFIVRGIHNLANTAFQKFNRDYYERRRTIGVFADMTLGFRNYLFLNVTGRNDWSSTLPVANRSYFYPFGSLSFVFSDAFNLEGKVLDYGKIRGAWSRVGRYAEPYVLQNIYNVNPNFLGLTTATRDQTFNNPNLQPEFTDEIELGAQVSFLKRLIEFDFTLYQKTSTNQIAAVAVPASSGYNFRFENFGEILNKGIEIDFSVRPVRTNNFNWDIHAVFTKNINTVVSLKSGVERILLNGVLDDISPYLEPGKPFGYLRGSVSRRDSAGNLLINPATGGMMQAPEPTEVGNPTPDYKMGITNSLSFKGLTLSVLFDMTMGGDLYSVTVTSLMGRGVTKDTEDRERSVIIPGVYGDPNTGEPILDNGKTIPNQTRITTNDLWFSPNPDVGQTFGINTASEWSVYDATVYRLREVNLSYDFPKSLFKKLPIGGARISISGRNLWYLAPHFPKYTRFDPEVNSFGATSTQGIELSAAPTTKRYGVNLSVSF